MTANPAVIVAQAQEKFDQPIEFVQSVDASTSMLQMEEAILGNVLRIGALALEAFLSLESPKHAHQFARNVDDAELPYHSERGPTGK